MSWGTGAGHDFVDCATRPARVGTSFALRQLLTGVTKASIMPDGKRETCEIFEYAIRDVGRFHEDVPHILTNGNFRIR